MGTRRIGVLYPGGSDADFLQWRSALLDALGKYSWIEGRNLEVEWRFGEYDQTRYEPLAAALARSDVDALLTGGTPLTRALQRATSTVPIVTGVGDPTGSGFAESLFKPGGNITGLSWGLREKAQGQIALLREMAPTVHRMLILRSSRYGSLSELNELLAAVAAGFGIQTHAEATDSPDELETAFEQHAGHLSTAACIYGHGSFQIDTRRLAGSAIRHGIATVCDERALVMAGCLVGYTLHHEDQTRRFAALIDQVLRGVNPAEIPFELPTRVEFAINRQTAASLGLALTADMLQRADAVIG